MKESSGNSDKSGVLSIEQLERKIHRKASFLKRNDSRLKRQEMLKLKEMSDPRGGRKTWIN